MRKRFLYFTLLVLLAGWQAGCGKNELPPPNNPVQTGNPGLIKKVNDWLDAASRTVTKPDSRERFNQLRLHLEMDKIYTEKRFDDENLIVVPVGKGFIPTRNAADHPLHCLLFKLTPEGEIRQGHLVQYLPAAGVSLSSIPQGTFTNYYNDGKMPDCGITFMTTTGNYLYESMFRKGKLWQFRSLYDPQYATRNNQAEDDCIDWYLQTFINGVLVTEEYLFSTCGPYVEEGSTGGSSGGEEPEALRQVSWTVVSNPHPGENNVGEIKSYEWIRGRRNSSEPQGGHFTRIDHWASECNFCYSYHPYDVWNELENEVSASGQTASSYVMGDLHYKLFDYNGLSNTKTWRFDELF